MAANPLLDVNLAGKLATLKEWLRQIMKTSSLLQSSQHDVQGDVNSSEVVSLAFSYFGTDVHDLFFLELSKIQDQIPSVDYSSQHSAFCGCAHDIGAALASFKLLKISLLDLLAL